MIQRLSPILRKEAEYYGQKNNVKLILELRGNGMGRNAIARTRHISVNSVGDVFHKADENGISYEDVRDMDEDSVYRVMEKIGLSHRPKLNRLKELSKMYALFAPIQTTYKESQLLKGLAKMRYDKEHKDSLSKCLELKERMRKLLATTGRTLGGSFKTRADSTTGNRAERNGGEGTFGELLENNSCFFEFYRKEKETAS